jgi:serine/threonine protein phosphatase PrpC
LEGIWKEVSNNVRLQTFLSLSVDEIQFTFKNSKQIFNFFNENKAYIIEDGKLCRTRDKDTLNKVSKSLIKYVHNLFVKTLENNLSKSDDAIKASLKKQMDSNAAQMKSETAKFPKKHRDAKDLKDLEIKSCQKIIGGMEVGIAHAQGCRKTMEDKHLATSFDLVINKISYPIQLFGIFDGHGGVEAARFVRDHLPEKLKETLREFNQGSLSEAGIYKALKITFVRLNEDFKKTFDKKLSRYPGTTATVAMILDGYLWTANVGDSRTVLDNNGTAVQLSEDANLNERYKKGVKRRGGKVKEGRINGYLNMARSIGDYHLRGANSSRSKVTKMPLESIHPESHLILCCDGIYEGGVTTKQIVSRVNYVVTHPNSFNNNELLAGGIVNIAYLSGSEDNLSAMVVKIK